MKRVKHIDILAESHVDTLSDTEIRRRFEDAGYEFTDDPEEAIYVLRNGDLVSGGYNNGVRGEDNRCVECLFEDIDRYDSDFWPLVFARTGMVMLVPETKDALCGLHQTLSRKQREIINELNYNITRE